MGMAEPESLEKRVKKQKIMGGIRTYNLLVTRQTPQLTTLSVILNT